MAFYFLGSLADSVDNPSPPPAESRTPGVSARQIENLVNKEDFKLRYVLAISWNGLA